MRKTSKIVSLLLTVVMILGIAIPLTVSADDLSFSDVPSTHMYHEAIMNLVAEGIINGMGDGTYQPEGNVTRAQFAKIICYATSMGEITYPLEQRKIFTDVAAEHWAANNIKTAYDAKIINGMGDGTFAPENNVLYEQAVKMAVCALGYTEQHANREGGYPIGYLAIANRAGLLKGIKDAKQGQPLNRGAVAKLVDNMRDANQIVDGEETESIRDNSASTVLKAEGRVIGLYKTSLYAGEDASTCSKYQIEIEKGDDRTIFDASDMNLDINTYLGRSVVIYYEKDIAYDYPVVTNIALKTNKNEQVEIDIDLIRNFDSSEIEYYENIDSTKSTKVDYDSDIAVMYNGQATETSLEDVIDDNFEKTGTITLVFSNGGSSADVAFVKAYETVIVKSVDAHNFKVYPKNETERDSYILDTTDRNKNVTIKSGNSTFDFVRLKENNILSIAMSEDERTVEALVSTRSATGTVELNDGESIVLDSAKNTTYQINRELENPDDLAVGNYVTVYFDAFNKIARCVLSQKGSFSYGYLSQIALPERRNDTFLVMIYKLGRSNAQIQGQVYSLAEKVKIDHENYNSIDDAEDIERALKIAAAATNINPEIDGVGPEYGAEEGMPLVSQPVKFVLNSRGEVESILTNKATSTSSSGRLTLTHYVTGDGLECIADKTRLDKYKISTSTNIIYIPEDRINGRYLSKNTSFFKEGENYLVQLAGVNSTNNVEAIYVYGTTTAGGGETASISEENKPMIVKKASYESVEGERTKKLLLVDVLEGTEIVVYDGGREETEGIDALEEGDVIRIAYEEKVVNDEEMKFATDMQILAIASELVEGDISTEIYVEEGGSGINADFRTVLGVVRAKVGNEFVVVPGGSVSSGEDEESYTYVSSVKIYMVDTELESDSVNTGLFDEMVDNTQPDNISKVLIYTEKGALKSIVIFR